MVIRTHNTPREVEKTVLLQGKYTKEQLMVYVHLLGGIEDVSTQTTIQSEAKEQDKEKQLVESSSVP